MTGLVILSELALGAKINSLLLIWLVTKFNLELQIFFMRHLTCSKIVFWPQVCIDCFPRLHHCPTCRSAMCDERNLAMEQVSRLLKYPCRYHPMGCKEAFPLAKKSAHERDCPFLQLKCPFHGQCAFNGSLADVIPHLASEHSVTPVPVQPAGTLFYRAKVHRGWVIFSRLLSAHS